MGTDGPGQEPRAGSQDVPERGLLRADWDPGTGVRAARRDPVPDVVELGDDDSLPVVREAVRGGLNLLRQEPTLVVWSVLARMLRSVVEALPFVVLLFFVMIQLARLSEPSLDGIAVWASQTLTAVRSPSFLIGVGGVFGVASVLSWGVGVATDTGVLGALSRRVTAGRVVVEQGLFFKLVGERFSTLLGFGLIRGLLNTAALALGGGLFWLGLDVMEGAGLFEAPASRVGATLGLAVFGMLGAGLVLMVWMLCHVAQAQLMMHDRGIFESFSEAFELLTARVGEGIWLYLMVGGVFVMLWAVYVPFYGLGSMMGAEPRLALVGGLVQFLANGVLMVGTAIASVWSHGAAFTWVGLRTGLVDRAPSPPRRRQPGALPAIVPGLAVQGAAARPAGVDDGALEDLLPEATPHVVSWEAIRRGLVEGDDR